MKYISSFLKKSILTVLVWNIDSISSIKHQALIMDSEMLTVAFPLFNRSMGKYYYLSQPFIYKRTFRSDDAIVSRPHILLK